MCNCEERFQLFFFSCMAPGARLWFQPHLCVWTTHRYLLPRLPQSTQPTLARRGELASRARENLRQWGWGSEEEAAAARVARAPALMGAFSSAQEAGAGAWEKKLQWQPHPSCITQQRHFTFMAVPVSSTRIPGCGFPHSHLLRPCPHSQQQSSPWVCSPIPMF